MFLKEGSEVDYNLFLLRSTWAITLAVDSSNILYSCEAPQGSILPRAPEYGWQAIKGKNPPPTCTWSASKADRLAGKDYVAPNIAKPRMPKCYDDWDRAEEGPLVRGISEMMTLPVDEGHEKGDYY